MTHPWYAIHCEPNKDRQVERLLAHEAIEHFAPRIPATRRRNGEKALFPGYVFARLDLAGGAWGTLRFRPGIRRLVDVGGGPCPIDDGIMAVIRARTERLRPNIWRPRVGDRVRVIGGSFADLEGIFCEALSGDQRVAVLMDMMRREVRIELPLETLEPVLRGVA
jgi:transcriptional antiterminator RfaH